jgi:hypothetical protein
MLTNESTTQGRTPVMVDPTTHRKLEVIKRITGVPMGRIIDDAVNSKFQEYQNLIASVSTNMAVEQIARNNAAPSVIINGTKPAAITIDGRDFPTRNWVDCLPIVYKYACDHGHMYYVENLVTAQLQRRKPSITRRPELTRRPRPVGVSGLFVEGNVSSEQIMRNIDRIATDLGLSINYKLRR